MGSFNSRFREQHAYGEPEIRYTPSACAKHKHPSEIKWGLLLASCRLVTIVRDNADLMAVDPRKASDESRPVVRFELMQPGAIEQP